MCERDGRRLEVYVAGCCYGSEQARRLAREVARRFPDIEVRLIDLDDARPPQNVVAVPTYMVDGVVIALGNPAPEELFAHLESVA